MTSQRVFIATFVLFMAPLIGLTGILGCGLVNTNGTAVGNNPAPNAPIWGSGTFNSGSQTVTGQAIIYVSGNSYMLRLESLTAPAVTGLVVQISGTQNGSQAFTQTFALQATSGSVNYASFTASSPVFTIVRIINPSTPNVPYGSANIIAVAQ